MLILMTDADFPPSDVDVALSLVVARLLLALLQLMK